MRAVWAAGGPPSTGPGGTVLVVLALLCALAFWVVLYALVLSGFQERHTQAQMYASLRADLANEVAPLGGQITDGAPVALISASQAGINRAVVVEGTTSTDLQKGPGHRVDTVLPGQAGVSVVFGKSATFGAPFAHITRLQPGDGITAVTGQGTFTYRVTDVRRPGDPVPPLLSSGQGRLTLVSAEGSGWRSGWAPSQVVYVDANLVGKAQPSPGGGPTVQPSNQVAMAIDRTALTPLVLWLELLVVVGIGFVWAHRRWGGRQVWLVGVPAMLAILWVVTETAARLLPNLL